MYIQINIGRNIDNVPMNLHCWMDFQFKVTQVIIGSAKELRGTIMPKIEVHYGTGLWMDDDGTVIREDSAKIGVFSEPGFDLARLRTDLADLRDQYSQGSIALITESELI